MNIYYIIDFSTFVYRFNSVYKWAYCEIGGVKISTAVLVGCIRSLKSNIYDNIIIVLDGVPSRSKSILPSYKGTRVKDDTFSNLGVPKLEVIQFLTKVGERIGKNVSVVCSPLQETDEVISSLVHHIVDKLPPRATFTSQLNTRNIQYDKLLSYLQPGLVYQSPYIPGKGQAIISTTDGDFIQLQRFDGVYIDKSTSGKQVVSDWRSESTHGLNPCATIIYKAVYGDTGDNIPPIISMDKDIVKMISTIKTIEEVMDLYNALAHKVEPVNNKHLFKILQPFTNAFIRNFDVAFLKFVSYPIKLEYPDYRIDDTITKYNLKV